MHKLFAVAEVVMFGALAIATAPLWLPARIFVLWRDGGGFTRQDECESLGRLNG